MVGRARVSWTDTRQPWGIRQHAVSPVGSGFRPPSAPCCPQHRTRTRTVFEEYILFLEWSATSEKSRVRDGVDTFVFRDGYIRVQTVRYTLEPVGWQRRRRHGQPAASGGPPPSA